MKSCLHLISMVAQYKHLGCSSGKVPKEKLRDRINEVLIIREFKKHLFQDQVVDGFQVFRVIPIENWRCSWFSVLIPFRTFPQLPKDAVLWIRVFVGPKYVHCSELSHFGEEI